MKNTGIHRLPLYLLISLLLFSCNTFNGYKITGTVKNAASVKVYLEDVLGEAPVIMDTSVIVGNKFSLENYAAKGIYRLRFGEDINNSVFIFLDKKDKINIEADFNALQQYKITGSPASASIHELTVVSKRNFAALNQIAEQLKTATPKTKDSLLTLLNSGKKNQIEYIKKFVDAEKNNDVACFALNFMGPMMQDEVPYLISITEKLHLAEPNSKFINLTYQQFKQYSEELLAQEEGGIAISSYAPNIILQSPEGDSIQLKNLQGNYVLLDFWASWCQPCRMENPNVVALYKKYHDKGFEIFSVSLDANEEQWKMAIKKDGLIWKNHGSDFSGWNSSPAQMYSVKSIPATFLLDKKGKVIAKNLRGEELSAKLAELFPSEK
jgi:thiol-disulfide isomerase/thioredoxin